MLFASDFGVYLRNLKGTTYSTPYNVKFSSPRNLLLVDLWNVRYDWNLLQVSTHADIRLSTLFKWSDRLVVENATNDCFTYARHAWLLNCEKYRNF